MGWCAASTYVCWTGAVCVQWHRYISRARYRVFVLLAAIRLVVVELPQTHRHKWANECVVKWVPSILYNTIDGTSYLHFLLLYALTSNYTNIRQYLWLTIEQQPKRALILYKQRRKMKLRKKTYRNKMKWVKTVCRWYVCSGVDIERTFDEGWQNRLLTEAGCYL